MYDICFPDFVDIRSLLFWGSTNPKIL
uniref:Uncharacterized protein n=1 Tax=Arundo donax TaxID=35708 RepID=A0A0A9C068_ARUDO